jgi:chitinase
MASGSKDVRSGSRRMAGVLATAAIVSMLCPASALWAATNVAAGKAATSSGSITNGAFITNGDKSSGSYASISGTGPLWIQLDLGQSYSLSQVNLWHYFADGRKYHDVIVKLSTTADFSSGVTAVFNNDTDNSVGVGAGSDAEYTETASGKTITFSPVTARYVKLWTNGNTVNTYDHYVEVEVWTASNATPTARPTATATSRATATRTATTRATATPTTGTSGKIVGGYLTTWEPRSTLRYVVDNTNYNLIYVAFAIGYDTSTGSLRLDPLPGTSSPAQVKSEIQYANSKGKRVIVSVGGYCDFGSSGGTCNYGYNLSTTQKVDQFMASMRDYRNNWGFNGMDWDLEHGNRPDVAGIIDATKRMRTEFGSNWVIACAPGPNLSSWLTNWAPSIDSWAAAQGVKSFDYYGEQVYDLGLSEASYRTTIVSRMTDIANRFGASRAMLGNKYKNDSGTSLSDPNNGHVDISTTIAALNDLRAAGKNIRGSYVWTIQSDSDLSYLWQSSNGVGGDILAHP